MKNLGGGETKLCVCVCVCVKVCVWGGGEGDFRAFIACIKPAVHFGPNKCYLGNDKNLQNCTMYTLRKDK